MTSSKNIEPDKATPYVCSEKDGFQKGVNQIEHIPQQLDDKTRTVVNGTVRPASYEGKNEQGHWLCDAVVFYSNALFIANFAVQPSGMIEMLSDEPIAVDLPVKVDAPVS